VHDMVVGAIKRLFSKSSWSGEEEYMAGVPTGGLLGDPGPDFDSLLANIRMARDEIDRHRLMLMDEIARLKQEAVAALRSGDREGAEMIAAEIVMKKNLLKGLIIYYKALNLLEVRIKTTRNLADIVQISRLMGEMARVITPYAEEAGAEWAATILKTQEMLDTLARSNSILIDTLPKTSVPLARSEEVQKQFMEIVKEANIESESLVADIPAPIDYEELEEKLIDYIRANNGVINVKKAAKALGVSPKIVKETLYRLVKKGVIKVSKNGGGEAEATPM